MAENLNSTGINDEPIKHFLSDKKVLIADSSVAVRSGLAKIMKDLGVKNSNILLAQNYATALDEMTRNKPQVVVTDYNLGSHCGLKLLQIQRQNSLEPTQCLFFLITANSVETTVAEAAEEDVDSFILKPFTLSFFRDRFQQAAMAKIRPTGYQKSLTEGKGLLSVKNYDKAVDVFTKAMSLFSKPTLALYYKGHTNVLRMDPVGAEMSYRDGLEYNPKHYRCLTGLSELLFQAQKYEEAYLYAKKIAETFPLSPQMLETVLRLAVKNQVFDDIDFLYSIYVSMDFRTPELVKCMKSALLVSGAYRLRHSKVELAVDVFRKALIASGRNTVVFSEIIDILLRHEAIVAAEAFLSEFPPEEQGSALFQILRLRVQDVGGDPGKVLEAGRKILTAGTRDPHVYKILIRRSMECKFEDAAESMAMDAGRLWPDQKDEFMKLLKPD